MKEAHEVLSCLGQVMGEQSSRLYAYQRQSNAYFGIEGKTSGTSMDATGRPWLRMQEMRTEMLARRGAPNLIMPIVDDMVSLKGSIPLQRAIPDDETEEAIEMAQKRTYLIADIWDRSSMDVQQKNAAWYLSALGDVVYTLDPVLPEESDPLNPPGVYITVHNPKMCYYRFRPGRFAHELAELWITWEMSKEEVREEYGHESGNDFCQVVMYYDKDCKQVIVDEERVLCVEHKMGFIPAQWVRNKMADSMSGQADIVQAVDVHEEVQSLFLILSDSIVEAVYAPIKIRDAENVAGDTVEVGPRAVISVTATGDVTRVDPAPPPTAASQLVQQMQDALFHVTGTTPVRVEGNMGGSGANVSGRMVHSVQQPQENRIGVFQDVTGRSIERLNQKALLMYQKIPDLAEASLDIKGSYKGKPFALTTKGKDIGGLSRIEVKWDPNLGSTRHERLVMYLQAFAQGLIPGSMVIEQLGEEDPESVLKKAQLEKIMIQQYAQGLMPSQPPMAQPGGDPGAQQQQIMSPMQGAVGGQAGGDPSGGQGGGPGGPPGGGAAPPPVQPGPPQPSLPAFAKSGVNPQEQGMGPKPQTPDVMGLLNEAIGSLPGDVQADVIGTPHFEGGFLVVEVKSGKHVASGIIKRAFKQVTFPFPVKVKVVQESRS